MDVNATSERQATLATPRNMKAAEQAGIRCFALSVNTGEEFSATSGDYWNLPDDEPLVDSEGTPMVLAQRVVSYRGALTREAIR